MTEPKALCDSLQYHLQQRGRAVLAIDGPCGSGKSTLACALARRFGGEIIHMDDFFLPLSLRTPQRYREPGGNVHYERFWAQVGEPLWKSVCAQASPDCAQEGGQPSPLGAADDGAREKRTALRWPVLSYQKFNCETKVLEPALFHTQGRPLLIVEGSYSMRPELRRLYDLTVFLSIGDALQRQRILARNGPERYQLFLEKWIPLEERYFAYHQVSAACQLRFSAEELAAHTAQPSA